MSAKVEHLCQYVRENNPKGDIFGCDERKVWRSYISFHSLGRSERGHNAGNRVFLS